MEHRIFSWIMAYEQGLRRSATGYFRWCDAPDRQKPTDLSVSLRVYCEVLLLAAGK
jgi:hypothetical protein